MEPFANANQKRINDDLPPNITLRTNRKTNNLHPLPNRTPNNRPSNRTIFNNFIFRNDRDFRTDGDTLTDFQEVTGWTICLYSDNTGKPTKSYTITSDPMKVDTDNDGVSDAAEFGRSDPRKADTDADNIPDYRDAAPCGFDAEKPEMQYGTSYNNWKAVSVSYWIWVYGFDNASLKEIKIYAVEHRPLQADNEITRTKTFTGGEISWTYEEGFTVWAANSYDVELSVTDVNGNTAKYSYHIPSALEKVALIIAGAIKAIGDNIISDYKFFYNIAYWYFYEIPAKKFDTFTHSFLSGFAVRYLGINPATMYAFGYLFEVVSLLKGGNLNIGEVDQRDLDADAYGCLKGYDITKSVSEWSYERYGNDPWGSNWDQDNDGDFDVKTTMDHWMQDFIDTTIPTGYPKWWVSPGKWGVDTIVP